MTANRRSFVKAAGAAALGAVSIQPQYAHAQPAPPPQNEDPEFIKLSAVLTGVDQLPATVQQVDALGIRKNLSQIYWERLRAVYPTELVELLVVWNAVSGSADPEAALAARLGVADAAAQRLRVAARQICKIWYLSTIDDPKTNASVGGDIGQYQQSVIWKVIGAPVPGYSNAPHGYWANKPVV